MGLIHASFAILHTFWLIYSAYTGRFCDEDLDGCTELTCFAGVQCMDVPAPGIRATCEPCPTGYSGDGLNCIGRFTTFSHVVYLFLVFIHAFSDSYS